MLRVYRSLCVAATFVVASAIASSAVAAPGVGFSTSEVRIKEAVAGTEKNVVGAVSSANDECISGRTVTVSAGLSTATALTDSRGKWKASLPLAGGETVLAALQRKIYQNGLSFTDCGTSTANTVALHRFSLHIVAVPGTGAGTVDCTERACEGDWTEGDTITATALPAEGSHFIRWDAAGPCASVSTTTCSFTIRADTNLGARFDREPTDTYLTLHSDVGDYIGQGRDYSYEPENAHIVPTVSGRVVSLSVRGDQKWDATFEVPNSLSTVEPGTYEGVTRYPFDDKTVGGMDFSGEGRGCNQLTGWFAVDDIGFFDGALDHLALRFEQHCEGGAAALHGELSYDVHDAPVFTDPGPAPDWQPPADAVPSDRSFLYLQSEPGDYIGQGRTEIYTTADGALSAYENTGLISGRIADWNLSAKLPDRYAKAQVGYYPDLMRYPFNNPVKGGLSFWGEGRGCNKLTGWFAIDDIGYEADGSLDHVTVRFEQHCEGATPALRAKLVFDNDFPV